MRFASPIITAMGLAGIASAASVSRDALPPSARVVYQFPNATFIENIATRSNGNILFTTFDRARLYTLDPTETDPEPRLVVQVPNITALTGIAEIAPDTFGITGGESVLEDYDFANGTAIVATVEFRKSALGTGEEEVILKTIASVPDPEILNGMRALPGRPGWLLTADSKGGRIYRVNTFTGSVEVTLQDDRLTAGPVNVNVPPLGVNGIEVLGDYLYLTNSARQFYGRIRIDTMGSRRGDLEILRQETGGPAAGIYDDFALRPDGTAYIGLQQTSLVKANRHGRRTFLVGPEVGTEFDLSSPTSAVTSKDGCQLYVVTGGISGMDGSITGGQIVAVTL